MINSIIQFAAVHPLITAMAACYVLTFLTVRQVKPYLEYLHETVNTRLPEDLEKRGFLRVAVFICGLIVSLVVTAGLIAFNCCGLTWLQALYVACSVGFLAPMVYDGIMLVLAILESLKILPGSARSRIERWFDPKKDKDS
jgi:hypothetical protein